MRNLLYIIYYIALVPVTTNKLNIILLLFIDFCSVYIPRRTFTFWEDCRTENFRHKFLEGHVTCGTGSRGHFGENVKESATVGHQNFIPATVKTNLCNQGKFPVTAGRKWIHSYDHKNSCHFCTFIYKLDIIFRLERTWRLLFCSTYFFYVKVYYTNIHFGLRLNFVSSKHGSLEFPWLSLTNLNCVTIVPWVNMKQTWNVKINV